MKKFLFSVMALFTAVTLSFAQTALPYTTGFEDAEDNALWQFDNGSNANAWVIGEAVNNGGTHALYLSNDGGTTNAYSHGAQLSIAYRSFAFTAGQYNISFDWQGNGESTWDGMEVFLVPESVTPVSAATNSATWGDLTVSRNAPTAAAIETAGWFRAVAPTPYSSSSAFFFSVHTTWETGVPFGVTIPAAGNYKLVFVWLNDGSGGSQPAAAVDNLSIQPKLCGDMGAITVNNITETTADISFATIDADQYQVVVLTANVSPESAEAEQIVYNNTAATLTRTATGLTANTPYYVYVRAVCGENFGVYASTSFRTECGSEAIPYTNDFESEASGTVPNCWTRPEALSYPKIYAYSSYTGSQCLYYYGGGSTSDQIVILPNFSQAVNTLMISFYYKATVGSSNGVPQVGYVTDKSDVTTFVALDTLDQQSSWESYEFALAGAPATATNIAIRYSGGTSNYGYFYLDDLTVKAIPNCMKPATLVASDRTVNGATLTWTAGGSETSFEYVVMPAGEEADWTLAVATDQLTVTLTTLTVDTDYDFYVRAACGETEKSEARSTAFSTLGYCKPAPTSVDRQGMIAVALGGVEQTTAVHATAAPYYTNNSNLTFEVAASTATSIDVTYATGYTYGTVIWVDWNNDMDFTADEVVFAGTSTNANPTTLNCPFTVPATQPEGTYRLRIGGADSFFDSFISGSTTTVNSCSSGTYLVYEDYSITVLAAPSCLQPTNVTVVDSTITASSATLTCVAGGSETNWYVSYKAAADEDWTIVSGAVDTPYVLNGLNANTAYQVRMAAVCGNDTSEWSAPVAFRTACGIESMPYADDFENGIYCWTVGNAQSTSSTYIPSVSSTYKRTGNNGMRLYAYIYEPTSSYGTPTHADSSYAILPVMDYGVPGMTGYTLSFYAKSSGSGDTYYKHILVGAVTNPADISTFELIQDVEITAAYENMPYEVILGSYAGTGTRLALLAVTDPAITSGTRYGSIYVDDIAIVRTPTCQPLAKIEAANVGRRNITVALTPKAGHDLGTYDLVCSATELDAAALEAAEKTVVTDTNLYEITGLNRETTYYIYVRANCGEGDVSTWVRTSATTKGLNYIDEFIAADGTSTNSSLPINSTWTDTEGTHMQMIYPADMLTGLSGITINSLHYYANGTNSSWTNAVFEVRMMQTETATMGSDFVATDAATLVYTGTVTVNPTDGMLITLATPFTYTEGNLLIDFLVTTPDSYNSVSFYGITTTEYQSRSRTSNSKFLPKVGFGYPVALDPCPAVTDMAFELLGDGTTEARVTWTTADADYLSAYEYVRSTVEITDFSEVTGTPLPANATSIEFNDLQPETTYYVYIRAICEAEGHEEGSSNWVGIDTTMNANCPTLNGLALNLKANNAFEASWNTAFEGQALSFRYILSTTELDAAGIAAAEPALADTNVIELTELLNDQMYYFYVASACGASTSEYIVDSIKTPVACQAVQNLTAARIEHNRALITWNKAPFATENAWEIGFVGDEENAIVVDTTMHMFIGLTPETAYNVYVKALCSETSESAIATVSFTTEAQPSDCMTLGSGTTTSTTVPTYTYYNYTLSEQIYTAAEIGQAGSIQEIAFYITNNSHTRTLNVYLLHTEKNDFASTSDWVNVTANDLVYTGSKTFVAGGWNTITLTTPFAYNGSDNLLLVIADNTGTSGTSSNSLKFSTYATTDYQTMYKYQDASYIDPTAEITLAGTRLKSKNQIQFCFEPKACPDVTALTISDITPNSAVATWEPMGQETSWNVYLSTTAIEDPATITNPITVNAMTYAMAGLLVDQDYWFYVQPVCTGADSWRVATFRTVATCFPPTALAADSIEARSALVSWTDEHAVGNYTVAYGPAAEFDINDATTYMVAAATATSVRLTGLTPETNYKFAVRANCDDMSSRYSTEATFRTAISCYAPTALVATNITISSAVITWTDLHDAAAYTLYYGEAASFDLEDPDTYTAIEEIMDTTATLTELNDSTNYMVIVKSVCGLNDESANSAALTFRTANTYPYFMPAFTAVPSDWKRYSGLLTDTVLTANLSSTTSGWFYKAGDAAISTNHVKLNIYGTTCKYWFVSPAIDMTGADATAELVFDAALCDYSYPGTAIESTTNVGDDKFAVIISRDGGLTWLAADRTLWAETEGADYQYTSVPATGQRYTISLAQYAGEVIRIAFYGESTTSGGDNDFHIGNISLRNTVNFTEETCQGEELEDNHGFEEATTDSVGTFHFEGIKNQVYTIFDLTVYEQFNEEVIIETAYVGDHYVDRFYDFYVQLGDEEAYGFEETSSHGCDSVWLVTFNNILTAETILEDSVLAEGETILWHGQTIEAAGLYYDTVRSEMGGVMAYYELTVTEALPPVQGKTFELVTAQLADWTGNYLIVFADNKAHAALGLIGSGTTAKDFVAVGNELTIVDNKITTADSCYVTITAMGTDGYSILLPDGNYLNRIHNGAAVSATAEAMAIDYTANGIQISGSVSGKTGTYYLYCNANNGTPMYRFYVDKSGTAQAAQYALPQLYKEVSGEGPGTAIETIDTANEAVKVILNGNLYIIRDNQWYDATGRLTVDPRK